MFVNMDTDDSGTLSIEEFKKAMALHPDDKWTQAHGQALMDAVKKFVGGNKDMSQGDVQAS